jgi:hypothetical protein
MQKNYLKGRRKNHINHKKTLNTKTLSKLFSALEAATQILDDPNLVQSSACWQQIKVCSTNFYSIIF